MMRRVSVQLFACSQWILYKSNSAPTVSPLVVRSAFFSSPGSAPSKIRPRCCVGAFPRVRQEDVGIAAQADSPESAVVPVVQRKRLVARRCYADGEAWHDRVEHLIPFPLRFQEIEISSG
jgi:hypothetical protein